MRYSYQTFLSDKPFEAVFSKKPRVLGLNFPLRYNVIFLPRVCRERNAISSFVEN